MSNPKEPYGFMSLVKGSMPLEFPQDMKDEIQEVVSVEWKDCGKMALPPNVLGADEFEVKEGAVHFIRDLPTLTMVLVKWR